MLRISQLVVVFVFALEQVTSNVPHKILVTLYYESQCPDSKDFIIHQLQPTINLLHKYISLRFVPFGKARSINNGFNGFQCQHGPTECTGNLVQSCALDLMQERNDVEKVSYVVCEMKSEAGTRGDMQCVRNAGLRPGDVKKCVHSYRGMTLQLNNEHITNHLRPNFIPTITIDGVFNQEVQDSSLVDFTGTLCALFRDIPPCAEHYNTKAMRYILL